MVVAGIDSTYDQLINNILNARGRFSCGDEYHERHHIVPKCMGGSDDEENLIDLFAREHFEAHRLLALENQENDKLIYAWWAMSHLKDKNQKRAEISAEEYEEAKQQYSKIRSQKVIGENNPMFGISPKERMDEDTYLQWKENIIKSTNSDEFKTQARDRNIGKKYTDDVNKKKGRSGPDHHLYGKHQSEETKQKLREANTGKVQSEETRKKISAATSGENNPFYGRTHTEESRKKISDAKTGKPSKIKGADKPNARKIIQYDLDGNFVKIWDYMKQAADTLNISYTGIHACCKGKQKTACGFIWRYFDENKE
jgi:group I intron endonuclease